MEKRYRKGYRFKLVGVLFQELVPLDQVQTNLFWKAPAAANTALMRVVDQVNGSLGAGTLRLAAEGFTHRWATRFECKSPCYTTRWNEIPFARVM